MRRQLRGLGLCGPLDRASPSKQMEHQGDQGHHQQQMDKPSRHMERQEAHQPAHQQSDKKYQEHKFSFRFSNCTRRAMKRGWLAKGPAVCLNMQMGTPSMVMRCT